jgi:thiamine-monophosphate kinase
VGVALTAIGHVITGAGGPQFLDAKGEEIALKRLSYSHF